MLNAKFLLTYAAVAAGTWGASIGPDRWQLVLQVACAVVMSLTIFLAVLRGTEDETPGETPAQMARH